MAIGGALLTIALTACHASAPSQSSARSIPSTANPSIAASPTPPSSPTQSAGNVESDQQAAVQTIQNYYSAINRQDYRQAYLLWDREGAASQQSFEQFKQGFANTASTTVTVGEPGRVEGAAGSLYIEIPVTITAVTENGTQQQFRGSYVLRRVNSVPGSTLEEQQWHLYSAHITQVPYSSLGKGFLTGKIDETATFESSDLRSTLPRFTQEALKANQVLINLLNRIAEQKQATPAQIALAWLLAQKP